MIARALIVVAAAAAGVWLGLGLHSARLLDDAQDIASVPPEQLARPDAERALTLFERGRRHTPDTQPLVNQAGLLARLGREREAVALAREAARREPQSSEAWALIAIVARRSDPRLAAVAGERVRELNPPVPPAPR